nr:hypothetical protein [Bacillus velezensis]
MIEDKPKEIHIALYPEDNGEITYEIYSEAENDEDPVIHSQGEAVITEPGGRPDRYRVCQNFLQFRNRDCGRMLRCF